MFSSFFLKSFRILLLPFALLYWMAIAVRNWLYDKKILRSTSFGLPVICIGNLSVGGTGKSPMVEYIVEMLRSRYKIATLSRGYKRRTKGYSLAHAHTTALEIGDEPMQFHIKFPEIPVAVGEERIVAIPLLLHDRPDTQVILLDDAFQHRAIKAGLNILLTDAGNLFTRDFYLPTGDLRDLRSSYKRADMIVVTKCSPSMTENEAALIRSEVQLLEGQQLFFTSIEYDLPYHIIHRNVRKLDQETDVLLVTGIANPEPLKKMAEASSRSYYALHYADHYIFTIDDLKDIKRKFDSIESANKIILTTEKDAVRLLKFGNGLDHLPFFVLPVRHHFLFNRGETFNKEVIKFIEHFKKDE